MKINATSQYLLLTLSYLADFYGQRPVTVEEISRLKGIPRKYLEQLLLRLTEKNLVLSKRGREGGYSLSRDPKAISAGEVVSIVDPMWAGGIQKENPMHAAVVSAQEPILRFFEGVEQVVNSEFEGVTLADLKSANRTDDYRIDHLDELESEGIFIMREVAAEFKHPVLLYSIGKDSSVLVRLAQKAFHPAPIPFPLLHVDTTFKFQEMIQFRDALVKEIGAQLIVHTNREWLSRGLPPIERGVDRCSYYLKTVALLDAITTYGFDAVIGGARREEEKSRAKERIFSFRNEFGVWDPKNQRPEVWSLFNSRLNPGESMRVFPLSNWTELDVWEYIRREKIPVVPLYFAQERDVVRRGGKLFVVDTHNPTQKDERIERVWCRFRSLGCSPCTAAIESRASNVDEILAELAATTRSERENRLIDAASETALEDQKRKGYF